MSHENVEVVRRVFELWNGVISTVARLRRGA